MQHFKKAFSTPQNCMILYSIEQTNICNVLMNSPPPLSRMGRYMNVSEEGIINSAFLRKEFRGQKYNECERWAIEWVASCLRVGGCDYSLLQDLLQHLGHFHRRGKMRLPILIRVPSRSSLILMVSLQS